MSKQTEKRKIEYIAIDALKEYERNTRTHDAEQVEQLKRSITEFGFTNPVLIDENNVIIAGHGRRSAARELGMKEVPCLRLSGLTESQVKALRIADNQLALNAGWDEEMLRIELADLKTEDFDLDLLGFSLDELEQYLEPEKAEQTKVVEDEAPAADNVKRRCKRGEIWQLGEHRLMCGDSTNADDVARLMNGEKADLLLTDPPYGVNIVQCKKVGGDKPFGTGTTKPPAARAIVKATEYMPIKGDESTDTARKSFEIAKEITDTQVIFGGNYFTDFLPPSRCWVVWDKGVPDGAFFAPVELAWVNIDANAKLYKILWSGLCREGDRTIEGAKRMHPTQKPVSLCANIIDDFTKDNASVLDLFGGSGSTLIACEQLNRKCRMMEYEEHYCDVIIQRWETLTDKTAKKIK